MPKQCTATAKEKALSGDLDLAALDFTLQNFGEFLRHVRQTRGVSIRDFEEAVGKTRAYISDIERGKNKPPDKALLDLMIEKLNLNEYPRIVNKLYDLAAVGRNAVPDDLKDWIMEDTAHRELLRACRDKHLTPAQMSGLLKVVEDM